MTHLTEEVDRTWFGQNTINGIPMARRWKAMFHNDQVFGRDPKNPMRGKNQLQRYLDLVDYDVKAAYRPGHSAQRIRSVRNMLEKRCGDYTTVTAVTKAKWTKALKHNFHDCEGLHVLMVRCATDLD